MGLLAAAPSASAQRVLGQDEVDSMLRSWELLRTPCRYVVEEEKLSIDRTAAGLPAGGLEILTRAVEAHLAGRPGVPIADLDEAFEDFRRLAEPLTVDYAGVPIMLTKFKRRVAWTHDVTTERAEPYVQEGHPGLTRTPLFYVIYDAGNEQIEIRTNKGHYVVRDPRYLVQPVPIGVAGLWFARSFRWQAMPPIAGAGSELYRLQDPDIDEAFLLLETSPEVSGLPLGCSLRNPANEVVFLGRFEYGPTGRDDGLLWLKTVYRVSWEQDVIIFFRMRISEVEFEVDENDFVLEVEAGARIWDFRRPVTRFWGNHDIHWPPEVRPWLRRLPGDAAVQRPIDPAAGARKAEASVAAPLPWPRIVAVFAAALMFVVAALAFRKKKEVAAS